MFMNGDSPADAADLEPRGGGHGCDRSKLWRKRLASCAAVAYSGGVGDRRTQDT